LLPFRTTHASTTPAQFSHADQYLVRTTAGALLPSYFSIVVAARGVAGSNCTRVRVELLPPPALRTAWGGLDETFNLTTRAAALANVFAAPPAALNASSGNWTLVVSTWPHTTCAYTVTAKRLDPAARAPANVTVGMAAWRIVSFNATLARPVTLQVCAIACAARRIDYLLFAAGTVGESPSSTRGTLNITGSGNNDTVVLLGTVGAPAGSYAVAFLARSPGQCVLHVAAPDVPTTALLADTTPREYPLLSPGSVSSGGGITLFRVPYSGEHDPFPKLRAVGSAAHRPCLVEYSFYADSFFAGSTSPVWVGGNMSSFDLFAVTGSPTLFVSDSPQDSQREDYLLSVTVDQGQQCGLQLTVFPARSVPMSLLHPVVSGQSLSATGAWVVLAVDLPHGNRAFTITFSAATETATATTTCTGINVALRAQNVPNGPWGMVPWDITNASSLPVTVDLEGGFPAPFAFIGKVFLFADTTVGACNLTATLLKRGGAS
jgi:hypothetical protein